MMIRNKKEHVGGEPFKKLNLNDMGYEMCVKQARFKSFDPAFGGRLPITRIQNIPEKLQSWCFCRQDHPRNCSSQQNPFQLAENAIDTFRNCDRQRC
jgi:hypothetical protein